MKSRLLILLRFASAVFLGKTQNPIIQTKFTADPAPVAYRDTAFLYTIHNEDDAIILLRLWPLPDAFVEAISRLLKPFFEPHLINPY